MVTYVKVRTKSGSVYCVNPDAITHFYSFRDEGLVYFKCWLGGAELNIPKEEFEQKILPYIRLAN